MLEVPARSPGLSTQHSWWGRVGGENGGVVRTALAATSTLVAMAFALSTFERWVDRRRPHELAWTASLAAFTLASGAQWAGAAAGWGGPTFRVFYLFGPIVSVPALALGTVYLLGGPQLGHRTAMALAAIGAFAAGVLVAAPLTGPIEPDTLPQGSDVFGALPRILAGVCSGVAALVVVGGAVWSGVRLARRRASRRLAAANALVALGTLLLSAGGALNSVFDAMTSFAVTHAVGITVVFVGFLVSNPPRRAVTPLRRIDVDLTDRNEARAG
ncbi:MAG: hypothetical protein ACRD0U_01510 [Acidimicrobiales bacterium]